MRTRPEERRNYAGQSKIAQENTEVKTISKRHALIMFSKVSVFKKLMDPLDYTNDATQILWGLFK